MSLKSVVKPKPPTIREHTCLMQVKLNKKVVAIFHGCSCLTIIATGGGATYKVGELVEYSKISIDSWEPFLGSVTLSND